MLTPFGIDSKHFSYDKKTCIAKLRGYSQRVSGSTSQKILFKIVAIQKSCPGCKEIHVEFHGTSYSEQRIVRDSVVWASEMFPNIIILLNGKTVAAPV